VIPLLVVFAVLVAVTTWRLHRGLARAMSRQRWAQVRAVAEEFMRTYEAARAAERARLAAAERQWWASLTPEERFEHNRRAFMYEERVSMSILRPESVSLVADVAP
jgi:hypothetical protein